MNRALLATALLAGCVSSAKHVPGTLPGQAHGALQLTAAQVESKTVATDGTPSDRKGTLTTMRYSMGGYFTPSRFGAISGAELTVAAGYLTGDAAQLDDMSDAKHYYFENEVGGVIMPFSFSSRINVAGDFGVGYTLDDRYTYAGGRLGLAFVKSFKLDGAYRRHWGATVGNENAHEDRFRGWITIHRNSSSVIQIGFDYTKGDQRAFSHGVETAHSDYLLRGRYEMFAITLGVGDVAASPKLEF